LGLDVFERIDPIPTWRDPLHWPSLNWICIQRARQHGRFQPAPPDRATQLMGHDPVLQLTDPPPELDQFCPQARIVRLPNIAGDQMIGQPQGGRDREQRAVLEGLILGIDYNVLAGPLFLSDDEHLTLTSDTEHRSQICPLFFSQCRRGSNQSCKQGWHIHRSCSRHNLIASLPASNKPSSDQ
jgi:hypothetical protein